MKNPINRETIYYGIGVTACAAAIALFAVMALKGPTGADIRSRNDAMRRIEITEFAMGRYWASLNITDPLAGIDAALEYCKKPLPVEQQKNAMYLCNTLVPEQKSALEAKVTANAIIQKKYDAKYLFLYGAVGLIGVGATMLGAPPIVSAFTRSSKLREELT